MLKIQAKSNCRYSDSINYCVCQASVEPSMKNPIYLFE
jgi:hypothetical protein